MNNTLTKLFCCPKCKGKLLTKKGSVACLSCKKKYPTQNGIVNFSVDIQEKEMNLSQKKWDKKYQEDAKKDITAELNFLEKKFFHTTWNQITGHYKLKKQEPFLEIGCGTFYLGRRLAKMGYTVVGIDMSMEALQLAKRIFEKEKIHNYLLVCGNVLEMPFKENSFNLLYGAGVIEHFKDTFSAIEELQRVMKPGGLAYNTVPYLNIGSLTYRQIWGNTPRLPVLEEIITFIHTKILQAKHMRFGFELSFTQSYLRQKHLLAGFSKAKTGQFDCQLDFDYIKNPFLHKLAVRLATNSPLFWPMIYVAAKK
jgi:ubiquinone/menaquinone biosynthesis C-methylase UbiE